MTSTGSGKRPSTSTILPSSTMQTKRRAAAAMIFSRVSAPPPPLMSWRCEVASSAPSTYRSRSPVSFNSRTRMPAACRRLVVAFELETAAATRRLSRESASMKRLTVEPVPTPIVVSGSMSCAAASATLRFASSWLMLLLQKERARGCAGPPLFRSCRVGGHARHTLRTRTYMTGSIGIGAVFFVVRFLAAFLRRPFLRRPPFFFLLPFFLPFFLRPFFLRPPAFFLRPAAFFLPPRFLRPPAFFLRATVFFLRATVFFLPTDRFLRATVFRVFFRVIAMVHLRVGNRRAEVYTLISKFPASCTSKLIASASSTL